MWWNVNIQFSHILEQHLMVPNCTAFLDLPLALTLFLHDTDIVDPLKDHHAFPPGHTSFKQAHKHRIATSENTGPCKHVVIEMSVDVFAVRNVDKGRTIQFVIQPRGEVEGQVVVDEDARALAGAGGEGCGLCGGGCCREALVFAVAVVVDGPRHTLMPNDQFNNKVNNCAIPS